MTCEGLQDVQTIEGEEDRKFISVDQLLEGEEWNPTHSLGGTFAPKWTWIRNGSQRHHAGYHEGSTISIIRNSNSVEWLGQASQSQTKNPAYKLVVREQATASCANQLIRRAAVHSKAKRRHAAVGNCERLQDLPQH